MIEGFASLFTKIPSWSSAFLCFERGVYIIFGASLSLVPFILSVLCFWVTFVFWSLGSLFLYFPPFFFHLFLFALFFSPLLEGFFFFWVVFVFIGLGGFNRLLPSFGTVQVNFGRFRWISKKAFLPQRLEVGAAINGCPKVLLKGIEGEGWRCRHDASGHASLQTSCRDRHINYLDRCHNTRIRGLLSLRRGLTWQSMPRDFYFAAPTDVLRIMWHITPWNLYYTEKDDQATGLTASSFRGRWWHGNMVAASSFHELWSRGFHCRDVLIS